MATTTLYQRLHTAQGSCRSPQLQRLHNVTGTSSVRIKSNAQNRAETVHLLLRNLMTSVALQTRVTHFSHEGVLAQTLCKNLRVLYSTFHAQCQGAQTAQAKPRLHRTGDCAIGDTVVTHRLIQLLIRGQSHTQQNIGVARKKLRRGVNHYVCAKIQGTLQNRGCEGVIHRGHNTQAASGRK